MLFTIEDVVTMGERDIYFWREEMSQHFPVFWLLAHERS